MKKMVLGWVMIGVWGLMPGVSTAVETTQGDRAFANGKSLEERIGQIEEAIGLKKEEGRWYDRLSIGGLVEVEAGHGRIDYDDPALEDDKSGDVDLATVELAVEAKIAAHVDGHVLLKYEEEEVFVDEGFITLTGTERFPAYLQVGRQYVPFGHFDSHFVTDPTTLALGETNEGAVVVGYRVGKETVDIAVGVFNGKTEKAGSDDTIANFAASVVVAPLENIQFGVSYTSNLAAADGLADQVQRDLQDFIGGFSVFAGVTLMEKITLGAEYLCAVEDFTAGELYSVSDSESRRPAAWNLELGLMISDQWLVAVRYGGSTDGDAGAAEFLAESQYGAVVKWGLFKNTTLALEYLHCDYENDVQTTDTVLAQVSVAF